MVHFSLFLYSYTKGSSVINFVESRIEYGEMNQSPLNILNYEFIVNAVVYIKWLMFPLFSRAYIFKTILYVKHEPLIWSDMEYQLNCSRVFANSLDFSKREFNIRFSFTQKVIQWCLLNLGIKINRPYFLKYFLQFQRTN